MFSHSFGSDSFETPWTVAHQASLSMGFLRRNLRRILEWVAIFFSRGPSWPRDWTHISCIADVSFTAEPPGKPVNWCTSLCASASLSLLSKLAISDTCTWQVDSSKVHVLAGVDIGRVCLSLICLLFLLPHFSVAGKRRDWPSSGGPWASHCHQECGANSAAPFRMLFLLMRQALSQIERSIQSRPG